MKQPLPFLLLAIVVALVVVSLVDRNVDPPGDVPMPEPLPAVNVGGWLNTPQPIQRDDLDGKWVAIDYFATWCAPCVASMPELVAVYDRCHPKGLELLSVSSEGVADAVTVSEFVATTEGMVWPVAYGGRELFGSQSIESIPTFVLYDPAGKEVWRGHGPLDLEQAFLTETGMEME